MTGLLSTISGYFTKYILLGTVLPVVVFIISFFMVVRPLLPADVRILLPLAALDPQWQVLAVSFCTVLISGVLYILNTPIIKWYEGYPWRNWWFGRLRTTRHKNLYQAREAKSQGTRTLLRAMLALEKDEQLQSAIRALLKSISINQDNLDWQKTYDDILAKWNRELQVLKADFPKSTLILPTKLGNVIRAFEDYPDREYGMDAVTIWPRLIAKIDPAYAASVDDAKTSFDFVLNISVLSAVSSLIQVAAGLLYRKPFGSQGELLTWLLLIIITAALAVSFYNLSIRRATEWGETVRGAFDLYRKDLLTQLGYELKVTTRVEERILWDQISKQMIYGDHPTTGTRTPDYLKTPTLPFFAELTPADIELRITRAVESSWSKRKATIIVHIENLDEKRAVDELLITDLLDNNFHYQWNSASVNGDPITVDGSNPYHFKIGSVGADSNVELRYKVVRLS
ncbi:MAG TPA: hypothetical protein VGW36_09675 [Pyrinomonadaceae bacterium]|nr:hypothetical protein [Pyrinomonadaceae bacterium]